MAHNLYQDTMAYVGETPWHQLGASFDGEGMTAEQAIEGAKLNYRVEKQKLYLQDGTETKAYATINMETKDILGYVRERYEVLQNVEAFSFFDTLLETGAQYITAGALGKGERIWLLAKMPLDFEPLLGDKVDSFCLLTNSHDGTTGVDVRFTPIRVVCQNTLNAAIDGVASTVCIRHNPGVKERLQVAAQILKDYNAYFSKMGTIYQKLAQLKVDDDMVEDYILALFGDVNEVPEGRGRTILLSNIQMYRSRLSNGMGVDLPGVANTAWWLYNAAVETSDYDRKCKDKVMHALWGPGAVFKQKAMDLILELVK